MNILFICSSNVCRSPYCEFIAKRLIEDSAILCDKGIEVHSAAVFNRSKQIFPKAVDILVREGFDEKQVRAFKPSFKRGDEKLFEQADMIIGMTKLHRLETPRKFRAKYVTLSEAATDAYIRIPDPFLAKSQERYDEIMMEIKELVEVFIDRLEKQYQAGAQQ